MSSKRKFNASISTPSKPPNLLFDHWTVGQFDYPIISITFCISEGSQKCKASLIVNPFTTRSNCFLTHAICFLHSDWYAFLYLFLFGFFYTRYSSEIYICAHMAIDMIIVFNFDQALTKTIRSSKSGEWRLPPRTCLQSDVLIFLKRPTSCYSSFDMAELHVWEIASTGPYWTDINA